MSAVHRTVGTLEWRAALHLVELYGRELWTRICGEVDMRRVLSDATRETIGQLPSDRFCLPDCLHGNV
jgi:hypothetical protein